MGKKEVREGSSPLFSDAGRCGRARAGILARIISYHICGYKKTAAAVGEKFESRNGQAKTCAPNRGTVYLTAQNALEIQ